MKSMTAYGKALFTTTEGDVLLEIHSVNRKVLDIIVLGPKQLLFLVLWSRIQGRV